MFPSSCWHWWKVLLLLKCSIAVFGELAWPRVQPVVEAHLSPLVEAYQNAEQGSPLFSYAFMRQDFGNPETNSLQEGLNEFSSRSGLADDAPAVVEEEPDEEVVEFTGRSPEAKPRFISKFKEWYKGKEKEKEKEKEEDNDNYHVVISHHTAQTQASDHHSSHHSGHSHGYHDHGHGHYGPGHGHYGHGHGHYGHGHYGPGYGYHGYGYGHGHGYHDHGHGYHVDRPDIHIHGYGLPFHSRPPPHHYYPYPYYPAVAPHHHHFPSKPVVQPIIINRGNKGKGKGKNDDKVIIISTGSEGSSASFGTYGPGYGYIH